MVFLQNQKSQWIEITFGGRILKYVNSKMVFFNLFPKSPPVQQGHGQATIAANSSRMTSPYPFSS